MLIRHQPPRPSDRRFRDVCVPARVQQVCQKSVGQSDTCPRSRSSRLVGHVPFRSRLGMTDAHRPPVTLGQGSEDYQDGAAISKFPEERVSPTGARANWQIAGRWVASVPI
jgi:hypothetical protein